MSKQDKLFEPSKTSDGCVADTSIPIFSGDMTHFDMATDPNRSADSIYGVRKSILTQMNKKKYFDSNQHVI